MKNLPKLFITSLLTTAILTACGGGGSSNDSGNGGGNGGSDPDPVTIEVEISGSAAKGIIQFGVVNIYGITDGAKDLTPLISGKTDIDGKYSLIVEDYTGPVIVEITADTTDLDNPSQMICDVIDGCNGIAFGEAVTLTEDFSLKAIVPAVADGEEVTTNVTALTSLATAFAEDQGSIDEAAAQAANSQVAQIFNLTGDLTQLAVVDITDADEVIAASGAAQKSALLNAALLSAALGDAEEGTSIEEALAGIASDFIANDGQLVANESEDGTTVSLAEILDEALTLIDEPSLSDVDFGNLEAETTGALVIAESQTPDETTNAEPASPEDQNAAQAAKNMVESVREFGLAATYDNSAESTFTDKLNLAADLVSDDDIDTILDSLGFFSDVMVTAIEANLEALDEGQALTTFDYDIVEDEVEITIPVTITSATNGYTYSIDMIVPATVTETVPLEIDLAGTFDLNVTETESETQNPDGSNSESFTFDGDASLALSGSISTSNVAMTINSGDIDIGLHSQEDGSWSTTTYYEESDTTTDNLQNFSVDLDVTLAQLTGELPISFTGNLTLDVTDLTIEESVDYDTSCDLTDGPEGSTYCYGENEEGTETITSGELEVSLSGNFTQDGESVNAGVVITVTPDVDNHQLVSDFGYSWAQYFQNDVHLGFVGDGHEDSELTGETEQNYVGAQFSIALEFDLAGTSEATGIVFSATRTGLEAVATSLDVRVGSNHLDVDVDIDGDDAEMTITNSNGSLLTLSETCPVDSSEECSLTGNIMIAGEEAAAIDEDTATGSLVITYVDGSFEVL
jgi:hypothetical protein